MHIRTTTSDDFNDVTAILNASYPELMKSGYDEPLLEVLLPAIVRANPALLQSGTYYLALTDERDLCGCGGWTKERPGTGEVVSALGHIRHFATHPNHVGEGVGRAIYAACEAQARSRGIEKLECYSSLNAEGFYISLGFSAIGSIDVPVGQGTVMPSIWMERVI